MIDRIGPFRIEGELGHGGMGVVYLARDTRLDRRVAIKGLPESLAADPDRLARFEREAKVLASLNHPNIGAIHGLEEVGRRRYLVLEYVEGETLGVRLKRGPIPIDEALPVAVQIAEALEAAHEKGIVHRDLKPGNVMVTDNGRVKVLDFGLARTAEGTLSAPALPDSPTVTNPAPHSPTIPGVILGTAGYMSPEQARGKPVDKRSDIFSFGCVLYEMLTGQRAFPGETVTDALGAVLHREPDLTALPADVPARLRELLTLCMAKDRRSRLHDIGDARLGIERAAGDDPMAVRSGAGSKREALAWGLLLLAVIAVPVFWAMRPREPANTGTGPLIAFTVQAPPGTTIDPEGVSTMVSPDGSRLVFSAFDATTGVARLWVRDFASLTSSPIEGTEGAILPFWSPDSRFVAYFALDALWRVGIAGGAPQRLVDAPGGGRGGAWSQSGVILFAPFANGPLHTVPQSGGPSTPALELDRDSGESGHRFPEFLPGGRRFVYSSMGTMTRRHGIRTMLASLDGGPVKELVIADCRATYCAPGWMLYERSGVLYSQRFDDAAGTLTGEAVATTIRPGGTDHYGGHFAVSASATGMVVCPSDGVVKSQIVEFGPDGKAKRTLNIPADVYPWMSISDAGDLLVVGVEIANRSEMRLIDLTREGVWTRLTEEAQADKPRWSHDGKWVYFAADREQRDLFRAAPWSGRTELVLETGNLWGAVRDVSFDGNFLAFSVIGPTTNRDMEVLDLRTKARRPLAAGPENEFDARFSPDGSLVALALFQSGRRDLYVETFPEAGPRVRATVSGIASNSGNPSEASYRWSADGSAILYVDADNRTVRSVKVGVEGDSIRIGTPTAVMQLPSEASRIEIGPDAKSAYGVVRAPNQPPSSIAVTLNWQRALPRAPSK